MTTTETDAAHALAPFVDIAEVPEIVSVAEALGLNVLAMCDGTDPSRASELQFRAFLLRSSKSVRGYVLPGWEDVALREIDLELDTAVVVIDDGKVGRFTFAEVLGTTS